MSLLHQIVEWSTKNLALWQQDALCRLFKKQVLNISDYEDLYAMLKSTNGIPDQKSRQPIPLTDEHVPIRSKESSRIILKSMKDLKHVNRIASNQILPFSPIGITVIYGANASGKSGYSRVLKLACRARDDSETVHPNVFDINFSTNIPEAVFEIEMDGGSHSISWKRGDSPPRALSTVAVFDGRCARAYLDNEKEVAYIPYGLDIVENLSWQVLPELSRRLDVEISIINCDTDMFSDLIGETTVGKYIAALSAKTDISNLRALGTLGVLEIKRLADIDNILSQPDPLVKAKELKMQAGRVNELVAKINATIFNVDDTAKAKLETCDKEAQSAINAELLAAANFQAGEKLLHGTGEQAWKLLFEAAKHFSIELAYPDKAFPYLGSDAKCPLCQQELSSDASKRLTRFTDFLKNNTSRIAKDKRKMLKDAMEALHQESVSFSVGNIMIEELKSYDIDLPDVVVAFETQVASRKKWLLNAVATHDWTGEVTLDGDPRDRLKLISETLLKQATEMEKATDTAIKRSLEAERSELKARSHLVARLKAIEELVERMRLKEKLSQCKNSLKTRAISDQTKEFSSKAVTEALKKALNTEYESLGIGHIKTKLIERADHGKIMHKLVLDIPVKKELQEILSEGEQRALAIGSFLAELQLSNHSGAIVFDDPVSSLDHLRRKSVAQRFIKEAKKRQVVVFTHDVTFLRDLWEEANRTVTKICPLGVENLGEATGIVSEYLPWSGIDVANRIHKLDEILSQSKGFEKSANLKAYHLVKREFYDLLRATWERAVEELLFNKVVERLEVNIKVMNLDGVSADQPALEEVLLGWQKASAVIDSHDHAVVENSPPHTSQDMERSLNDLKGFVEKQRKKRKEAETKLAHIKYKQKIKPILPAISTQDN